MYFSKKTIYFLIRIYKAVAEVTECHSGSEKGSLGHKTRLPSRNIKLIENIRKTSINGTNLCGMHTEQMTKALRFKRG